MNKTGPELELLLQSVPLDELIRLRLRPLLAKAGGGDLQLLAMVVAHVERALITEGLTLCGGHSGKTAQLLGLHRNTLRQKCREHGISPAGYRSKAGGA